MRLPQRVTPRKSDVPAILGDLRKIKYLNGKYLSKIRSAGQVTAEWPSLASINIEALAGCIESFLLVPWAILFNSRFAGRHYLLLGVCSCGQREIVHGKCR